MDRDQELSSTSFAPVVEKALEIVQTAQLSPIEEWIVALWGGNFWLSSSHKSQVPSHSAWITPFSG